MRYPACRRRLARRPPLPLRVTAVALPGGLGFALDVGEALTRLELREVLEQAGVRGNV